MKSYSALLKRIIFLAFILLQHPFLQAQSIDLQGQLSGWVNFNDSKKTQTQVGLRYLPALSAETSFGSGLALSTEISLNGYGTANLHSIKNIQSEGRLKPYRIRLRFLTSQLEIRAGLQKINFGSAALLRPLMWFDRLDPRDPLHLTDGVYALLGRYFFLNNTNIWGWALYGNDEAKGWEIVPTAKKNPEFGGRLQLPVSRGELAVTYHHRTADYSGHPLKSLLTKNDNVSENRFGLDGKWDIGIGLWLESGFFHQNLDTADLRWQQRLTIGTDYTFSAGNGLHVLYETLLLSAGKKIHDINKVTTLSALSLNYPLGLIDNLTGMVYYDWARNHWYRFLNWTRQYDIFSLNLIGFWNPDQINIYQAQDDSGYFGGKGIQVILTFNH